MKIITRTDDLVKFCARCCHHDFVTIDTEFLREHTYYSKLCLIQMAYPDTTNELVALIDPLSPNLSLDPFYALLENENITKVFHAARQDLEIFYHDRKILPKPFFDTQVAAMVCGFGEQVGYEKLVRSICNVEIDKSLRFTNWSQRPLSKKQMEYALADVTYLRDIYTYLNNKLIETNRIEWVNEENKILTTPDTYDIKPQNAWRRIKARSNSWKVIAAIKELAEFREYYAQNKNIPRSRVFKDDALMEIAAIRPLSITELSKSRLLQRDTRKGAVADGILDAIKRATTYKKENTPALQIIPKKPKGNKGISELLKVLLKAKAEEYDVASKLIANSNDLDLMLAGEENINVYKGWRADVFGLTAKRLIAGKVALSSDGKKLIVIDIEDN